MVIFNSYTYLKNLVSFSIKPLDIYYKYMLWHRQLLTDQSKFVLGFSSKEILNISSIQVQVYYTFFLLI